MNLALIIPAAGLSTRFSSPSGRSKLEEDLGGRSVLHRTVELFCKRADVDAIIVALPHDRYDEFALRFGDTLNLLGCTICRGGPTHRWETVRNAIEHVPADATHIAVHDAARPATPPELIDRIFEAARKYPAVIPAIDVPDTIKRVTRNATIDQDIDPLDAILGEAGKSKVKARQVEQTVPRDNLMLVQTPQVFQAELLRRAYAQDNLDSTDDAGLVERLGESVTVIEGDPRNVKITRPVDLSMVRSILNLKGPSERPVHKRF